MKDKIIKLTKILKHVGWVSNYSWDVVTKLQTLIKENKVIVENEEWFDRFRKGDLKVLSTWSTFDQCAQLQLAFTGDDLHCYATIYNGDNVYGRIISKRFVVDVIVPASFILEVENSLLARFEEFAKIEYKKYLYEKENLWIQNYKNNVL